MKEIKDADSLILGCTHFPLLKDIIKKVNSDLNLISSNVPVNIALANFLDSNNLRNNENHKKIIKLFTTSAFGELDEKATRFDISFDSVEYLEVK